MGAMKASLSTSLITSYLSLLFQPLCHLLQEASPDHLPPPMLPQARLDAPPLC